MPQVQAFAYSEASLSHSWSTCLAVRSAYFGIDPGTTWTQARVSWEAHGVVQAFAYQEARLSHSW